LPHGRPGFVERTGSLTLMLAAWGILLFRLNEVPPGFQHDQTFSALDAMQVLGGHYPIYFPDNFGRGPLFMYSAAGIFRLTGGHWVWSLHFTAVVWGMVALATTLLLARRYVPPAAALFLASLMAGSFWFLLAARLGVESISLLPLATAMLYCLDRGLARHSWPLLALGGVLGGIANYTYLASRALYALAPLLLVYLLLHVQASHSVAGSVILSGCASRPAPRRAASEESVSAPPKGLLVSAPARPRTRSHGKDLLGLLLSFGATVVVSGPLLLYLRGQGATADGRLGQLSGSLGQLARGDAGPLLAGIWDTVRAILWAGSNALPYQYNVPGRPALGPVWALCLIIGLVLTLARAGETHDFVLLAGLAVGLLPSLLSGADALYMRSICALPLLFILAGRGLWAVPAGLSALARTLRQALKAPDDAASEHEGSTGPAAAPHPSGPEQTSREQRAAAGTWRSGAGSPALRRHAPRDFAVPAVVLAGLLAWQVVDGCTAYFQTWAQAEPTQRIYNADFRAAAAFVDAEPASEELFIGTDRLRDLDSATFGFYQPRRTDVNWYEAPATPPLPSNGVALYLEPANLSTPPGLAALPGAVRDAFSIPAPYGNYDLLRGYRVDAGDLRAALRQAGVRPPAQPITYGDALRLDSAAVHDRGTYADLLTAWTVLAAWPHAARPGYPPAKPKFSLSMTDVAGYKWSQADFITSFPFMTWQPGQLLVEDSHLPLPGDLPPGAYSVRLAIYDDEQGALSQRSDGRIIAAAPVAATAQLGARSAAAATPIPPWPVAAGGPGATALRALGKWEPLTDLSAGLPAAVHLSWEANRPVATAGLAFRVQGRGSDGAALWEQLITPTETLPAVWPAGQTFRLTHRLLPASPVSGTVEAQVEICAEGSSGQATGGSPAAGQAERGITLGCAQVGPARLSNVPVPMSFPSPPQHPFQADWAGQISLAGYDLAQSGRQITLTLYWRAGENAVSVPLKRFVHATDAADAILAQSDAALGAGGIPATLWRPGECVLDQLTLQLPAGKQAAHLYVGLYDPDTGERLPVQLASGPPAEDGRAALPLGAASAN